LSQDNPAARAALHALFARLQRIAVYVALLSTAVLAVTLYAHTHWSASALHTAALLLFVAQIAGCLGLSIGVIVAAWAWFGKQRASFPLFPEAIPTRFRRNAWLVVAAVIAALGSAAWYADCLGLIRWR